MKRLPLVSLLALAGCTVGPNYHPAAVPPSAHAAFIGTASPAVAQAPLPDRWWQLFNDPALDRLIQDALQHNTDIRVAAANLARSRAVVSEARAGRLPSTTLSASATRNRISSTSSTITGGGIGGTTGTDTGGGTGAIGGVGGTTGTDTGTGGTGETGTGTGGSVITTPGTVTTNYFTLGFDASYEIDLFGGITRQIQAASRDAEAAAAQLDAARVSVAAETARNYALACGYADQANVARDTVRLQDQTVDLTRRLFQGGRATRRDLDQAQVLREQSAAQVPMLDAERRASLAALSVLTGRAPAEIDADAAACVTTPRIRQVLPVGDGTALLKRRPDIREADRTLAADVARIGVETAQLYPHISIGGSAGLGATKLNNLGKSSSFTYSFGPLLSWSFPNIAVARARIKQANAQASASLASFDGTVLTALQEVEQALARYAGVLDQNAALARADDAAEDAARLSRLRFQFGADSFLQLIQIEQDRAQARTALAQSNATLVDAQVSLFKALGGGWQEAPDVPVISATKPQPPATGS